MEGVRGVGAGIQSAARARGMKDNDIFSQNQTFFGRWTNKRLIRIIYRAQRAC